MSEVTREYLDTKFGAVHERLAHVETRLSNLDDSINKTTDDSKPSLRQQVTILKRDLEQFQSIMGKVFTLIGATPISVLIGYAALHVFGQGNGK